MEAYRNVPVTWSSRAWMSANGSGVSDAAVMPTSTARPAGRSAATPVLMALVTPEALEEHVAVGQGVGPGVDDGRRPHPQRQLPADGDDVGDDNLGRPAGPGDRRAQQADGAATGDDDDVAGLDVGLPARPDADRQGLNEGGSVL